MQRFSVISTLTQSYHIYKLSFLNFLLGNIIGLVNGYILNIFKFIPGKQPNGPGQFMFGSVVWEEPTVWVKDIVLDLGKEDENIDPIVPREPRSADNLMNIKCVTTERNALDDCNRNIAANGNRRRSERKLKQNETASIVDVIDKNGGRRKSIMV